MENAEWAHAQAIFSQAISSLGFQDRWPRNNGAPRLLRTAQQEGAPHGCRRDSEEAQDGTNAGGV